MSTSDLREYRLALPPRDRPALARKLPQSLQNDEAQWRLDGDFATEIQRRRDEMLRGEPVIPDWQTSMQELQRAFESGSDL